MAQDACARGEDCCLNEGSVSEHWRIVRLSLEEPLEEFVVGVEEAELPLDLWQRGAVYVGGVHAVRTGGADRGLHGRFG